MSCLCPSNLCGLQVTRNLVWSAWGINAVRAERGHEAGRQTPSLKNLAGRSIARWISNPPSLALFLKPSQGRGHPACSGGAEKGGARGSAAAAGEEQRHRAK